MGPDEFKCKQTGLNISCKLLVLIKEKPLTYMQYGGQGGGVGR